MIQRYFQLAQKRTTVKQELLGGVTTFVTMVGWNLSHRCRTEDALNAVEQAVLHRLPAGSREASLTLTIDNGTQFTSSRFLETLSQLGITHRRTAYHHPEGNSYIERFHRSLKEEEVWTAEYRSLEEARASIARWIEEYNQRPASSRSRKSQPARGLLGFHRCTKFGGPDCLVLRGALHVFLMPH